MNQTERVVLMYLSPLMEATAKMIGEQIISHGLSSSKHVSRVGSVVCQKLHQEGLVSYLLDLKAWRITAAGRAAICK